MDEGCADGASARAGEKGKEVGDGEQTSEITGRGGGYLGFLVDVIDEWSRINDREMDGRGREMGKNRCNSIL